MKEQRDQISQYIEQAYYSLSDEDQAIAINSRQIATLAYGLIDKGRRAPSLVRAVAIEGLTQRARAFCRRHTDWEANAEENNSDMFEDLLQDRYSVVRQVQVADGSVIKVEEQEVYVLRDHLTVSEVEFLCDAMDKKSEKISSHADALRRWNEERSG